MMRSRLGSSLRSKEERNVSQDRKDFDTFSPGKESSDSRVDLLDNLHALREQRLQLFLREILAGCGPRRRESESKSAFPSASPRFLPFTHWVPNFSSSSRIAPRCPKLTIPRQHHGVRQRDDHALLSESDPELALETSNEELGFCSLRRGK